MWVWMAKRPARLGPEVTGPAWPDGHLMPYRVFPRATPQAQARPNTTRAVPCQPNGPISPPCLGQPRHGRQYCTSINSFLHRQVENANFYIKNHAQSQVDKSKLIKSSKLEADTSLLQCCTQRHSSEVTNYINSNITQFYIGNFINITNHLNIHHFTNLRSGIHHSFIHQSEFTSHKSHKAQEFQK